MKTITYDDTLYQLVPKETDRAMDDAAEQYYIGTKTKMKGQWWWNRLYQAYLSAAPTPPAQPAEQPPIPESLWRSILDAGLTLHKEGDKWWVEKAQPADRMPLTEEQRAYVVSMWKGGNWNAGDIIDAVEAAHGITEP